MGFCQYIKATSMIVKDYSNIPSFPCGIAFHADVLRGFVSGSCPTRAVKFLSRCLKIPGGAYVQIIREPIGAVKVKMLTSQMRCTSSVVCDM